MRKIIIGDIHACLNELKELLIKVNYDKYKDKLILLGDYIDRGEYSFETLVFLKELKSEVKDNLVLIRGNHERKFLKKRTIVDELIWKLGGKYATILSFKKNGKDITYFNDWLKENTVTYYKDDLFQCCHAGILNEEIEKNSEYTLTNDRFHAWENKYQGKLTIIGHFGVKKPSYFKGDKKKYKTLSYDKELKLPEKGLIMLDTGCVNGNKLTAMIIENDKYVLQYVNRRG